MEVRAYRDTDAAAAAQFFTSAAAADATLEPVSEADWRAHVGRTHNRGGRDFVVAADGDRVVGILMSTLGETAGVPVRNVRVIVHPSHRGRGLGTALAARIDDQDDPPNVPLYAECPGTWTIGIGMVERRGFEQAGSALWMSIHDVPEPVSPPPGIVIRAYDKSARDDAAWTRLNDEGYLGTIEHSYMHAADLAASRATPGFALWMAETADEIVGLCHVKTFGDLGCVNSLVVTPGRRRSGLGRALFLRGLETLRETHEGRIRLTVLSHNASALALYRSVGFTVEETLMDWWLDRGVRPPVTSPA